MKKTTVPYGSIEVICGCMFSGKSTELIKRVEECIKNGQKVQVFNSSLDKRYTNKGIATHDLKKISATHITKAQDALELIKKNTEVVALDEVNFFTRDIAPVAVALAKMGKRVICCGLDLDFKAVPFESTAQLLAVADKVTKLAARCNACNAPATRTHRTVAIKSRIYVGGADDYEPLCADCFNEARIHEEAAEAVAA